MTAHKHATLMLQYAQDAMETDKPWELWEVRMAANVQPNAVFERLSSHPEWHTSNEYRRKPQTIKVGKWEFPKPITNELVNGVDYFYVKIGNTRFEVDKSSWTGNGQHKIRLESRRVHLTEASAQAHADVLNAICRGDVE